MVELNEWFRGLWHGRSLAFTVAAISLSITLAYLYFATRGPPVEPGENSSTSPEKPPFQ